MHSSQTRLLICHPQPKAATSIYCVARANALANKEAQQMATVAVPAATSSAATGTWAALAKGPALSVAGPAASRVCPTAAAIKVHSIVQHARLWVLPAVAQIMQMPEHLMWRGTSQRRCEPRPFTRFIVGLQGL